MTTRTTRTTKRPWTCGAATALLALLLALPAVVDAADGPVVGRYLRAEGQQIQLQLAIGSPAPASIIVTQTLPPGTAIVQAQPPVSRFDGQSGEAKWLLKGESGTMVLDLQLAQPIRAGEVKGQIRYKHPATGATVTENIAP
jgi:hypothetical protein